MRLEEKVSIVTGAGSGMGEAIAKLFALEGSKVVVSDLNEEAIERVVSDIKTLGKEAIGVKCNVSNEEDINNLFNTALKEFGKVDIVINNAGIMDNFVPVGDLTLDLFDKVMGVNVKGPWMLSKLLINYCMSNDKPGSIVNIASVGGLYGGRGGASYVMSKHAVIGLTKNICSIYNDNKIRCNAIAPGAINTNIGNTINNPNMEGMQALNEKIGPPVPGESTDIAYTALFLASDEATFINGETVVVDGGWTAV